MTPIPLHVHICRHFLMWSSISNLIFRLGIEIGASNFKFNSDSIFGFQIPSTNFRLKNPIHEGNFLIESILFYHKNWSLITLKIPHYPLYYSVVTGLTAWGISGRDCRNRCLSLRIVTSMMETKFWIWSLISNFKSIFRIQILKYS